MTRYISVLILMISLFLNCSDNDKSDTADKLIIDLNKNVETVIFIYMLAGNEPDSKNYPYIFPPLYLKLKQDLYSYKDHQAVTLMKELMKKSQGYFWMDTFIPLALAAAPFPEGKLLYPNEIKDRYSNINAKNCFKDTSEYMNAVNDFISAANNFYQDANVDGFINKNKSIYEGSIQEIKELISSEIIPSMEIYFGKANKQYTIIPSPALGFGSQGFGPKIHTPDGDMLFSVLSCNILTDDSTAFKYGFHNQRVLYDITIHEFIHSFVTPLAELPYNKNRINYFNYLFTPIQNYMRKQGYPNWWSSVQEHCVRACEIQIATQMQDTTRANHLLDFYVNQKKFVYIPHLVKSLKDDYEINKNNYVTFEAYFPKMIEAFSTIDTFNISL